MVKKINVSKAEAKRRAAQSQKDKKSSVSTQKTSTMVKQPAKKGKGSSGPPPYARLVLDPCRALFTQSSLPGSGGSTCVRCPFRQVIYAPTADTNVLGGATPAGTVPASDTLFAVLTPHCMIPGSGPGTLGYYCSQNETVVPTTAGGINADVQGLAGLSSFVGEMRPVAACVRITCMGSDSNNTGVFFGYEGSAKQFINHTAGSDANANFIPSVSAQNVIFNGQTTGDTYKTFEAIINYPNVDEDWQQFRAMVPSGGITNAGGNSIVNSADGRDQDFSGMPFAMVGVTSATPGCRYLIDGAIVYEWYPKLNVGYAAPPRSSASASTLSTVAKYVQSAALQAGGMLVKSAANYVTAGNANQVLGLLRGAYAAQNAGPPRLTW